MSLLLFGLGAGTVTFVCSCVNAWSERKTQQEEDVRESVKASEKAAEERAKEERHERGALAQEQRQRQERREAEKRREVAEQQKELRKTRTVRERMARWKKRLKKTYAVNTGRRAFVGKVIAVDEEGITFQDGVKAEKLVKYADLEACPVKPAALKNSAAWIFPVVSKAPEADGGGGVDLDDMHP